MLILRASILHTPRSPFVYAAALEALADGGLAVEHGRIVGLAPYAELRRVHPDAETRDLRPGTLLPGFVDTHVHYPQARIIGRMGPRLLDWLRRYVLPEEARLADAEYARAVGHGFVQALLRNGTTSALVFGSHFPAAQEILFEETEALGARITSGLVLSDRGLRHELHQSPERAYRASIELIGRWHRQGCLRYAVTPRFAVSTSAGMLEAAGALLRGAPDLFFQTHLNETADEVQTVRVLFPDARDYLDVYEAHGLVGPRSVFAHSVQTTDAELERLAAAGAAVAHCPSSNAFLGSGLFPMARHAAGGVNVALGSDVGAGTGFSLLKEGLAAYQAQMLRPDGYPLTPAHLLYLATRAGAVALGLGEETGDLSPGKAADLVLIRPRAGSTLATVLAHGGSAEEMLGILFTLGGEDCVARVYLGGREIFATADGGDAPES